MTNQHTFPADDDGQPVLDWERGSRKGIFEFLVQIFGRRGDVEVRDMLDDTALHELARLNCVSGCVDQTGDDATNHLN